MYFILKLIFLFWTFYITTGLTYGDLMELNAACYPRDTCMERRTDDDGPGIPDSKTCSCNKFCYLFNTCCIDSDHNGIQSPWPQPTCRRLEQSLGRWSHIFMVDRCAYAGTPWETLCNDEWNGEDDVLKLVPVTSLYSFLTYKNYFCFRCNEQTDDFVYWNVRLEILSVDDVQSEMEDVVLTYRNRWEIRTEGKNSSVPGFVTPYFEIPFRFASALIECSPNEISNCSNEWMDDSIRDKCSAYSAVIYIKESKWSIHTERYYTSHVKYRNAHCALCNFQSLDEMICELMLRPGGAFGGGSSGGYGPGNKKLFSFTHLLDVNRSDGDKVGKIQKCKENSVWDPFGKKCRSLRCALPGYAVYEGKCIPRPSSSWAILTG